MKSRKINAIVWICIAVALSILNIYIYVKSEFGLGMLLLGDICFDLVALFGWWLFDMAIREG